MNIRFDAEEAAVAMLKLISSVLLKKKLLRNLLK